MPNATLQLFTRFVYCLTACFILSGCSDLGKSNPTALIKTTKGEIELELYQDKAPVTVDNFIAYAKEGYYEGTIFHRVIPNFMIQGGGFDASMNKKQTKGPIVNEAKPDVPNVLGSIAMARTNAPHSATAQFFINVKDNDFLNKSDTNPGYAVFGQVTKGLEVAQSIVNVKTKSMGPMRDIPVEPIVIESVTIDD